MSDMDVNPSYAIGENELSPRPAVRSAKESLTRFICSNAVGLYICNSAGAIEGIARIPNAFAGTYFGISWAPASPDLILGHDPGQPDIEYENEISILKREAGRLSIGSRYIEISLSSPHQLTATPDQRILIANTARNALTVVQPDCSFRHIWFDGYEWDRYSIEGEEGSHFNSVLWRDGLVYVLAHNHSRGSYALILDSQTFEVKQKVSCDFRGCHNLWVTGEDIYTLSSFTGELRSMLTGNVAWSSGDSTSMVRGLAVGKKYIIIGDTDRVSRVDRNKAGGGVYIIDRSTMKTMEYIDFGYNGGVCDIRILNESDECHNVGPFAGEIRIDEAFTRSKLQTRKETKLIRSARAIDSGKWSIHEGSFTDDGGDIVIEPEYFGLATLKEVSANDGAISAEICFEHTPTVQQVGIVARHNGPRDLNEYVAFFEYYDRFVMFKWLCNDGSEWRTLYSEYLGSNMKYAVRYEFTGQRHVVTVDGKVLMDLDDGTILTGAPGFRMKGGRLRGFSFVPTTK